MRRKVKSLLWIPSMDHGNVDALDQNQPLTLELSAQKWRIFGDYASA